MHALYVSLHKLTEKCRECEAYVKLSFLKFPDFTVSDELNDHLAGAEVLVISPKPLLLGKDKPANEPETELRRKLCAKRATCRGTSEATE